MVIIKLPNVYTILKQRLTFKNSLKKQLELICSLLLEVLLDFTYSKSRVLFQYNFQEKERWFLFANCGSFLFPIDQILPGE